jgi:hypothetical protein
MYLFWKLNKFRKEIWWSVLVQAHEVVWKCCESKLLKQRAENNALSNSWSVFQTTHKIQQQNMGV